MTRQTWTAVVAAVIFVVSAMVLALVPVPYVAWTPGATYDVLGSNNNKPVIEITGIQTYPITGELRLTTVSGTRADSQLSLPEAFLAHLMPSRDTLPRDAVYAPGRSAQQVQDDEQQMMSSAQSDAVIAALVAAGKPVRELPQVNTVRTSGPANEKLKPGDLITSIDGAAVKSPEDVTAGVRSHAVGDQIVVAVIRDETPQNYTVRTIGLNSDGNVPTIGIGMTPGFSYEGRVTYGIDPEIGGGSGGLVFALAIFDKITPDDLIGGRKIAGTGTIDPDGKVGPIGGIHEKMAAAQGQGATIFLVPADNCGDTEGATTSMLLIKVTSLGEAVTALARLADPATAGSVARC